MPRFRVETNEEIRADLDTGFIGVNEELDPGLLRTGSAYAEINQQLLGPGLVSKAINQRFDSSTASTRKGLTTPVHFNPTGGTTTIYGSGGFSNPNGREWMLLAVADGVWQFADLTTPARKVALPAGVTITKACSLVQTFDKVLLFRGTEADDTPLEWDGTPSGAFQPIVATSSGDYTAPIPNSDIAVVFGGRVWVKQSRDYIAVSDLLDYTRYDPILQVLRINQGDDDAIVAIQPFRRESLLVLKDQSIHRISGAIGDLTGTSAEVVNSEVGCAARYSVSTVGGDVFWLAATGVHRLSETVENSMIVQETPVSRAIQPTIDRINWLYADAACALTHGRFYYLAVPLDGATVNNAILVYDTTTSQWQGYDTFDAGAGLNISRFHVTDLRNRKTAFLLDFVNGKIHAMNQGLEDEIGGTIYQIAGLVRTRGYVCQSNEIKRQQHALFEFETHNPRLTIQALNEGIGEARTLTTNLTRSRTVYNRHGQGTHDITDPATHAKPGRQDYAILTTDAMTTVSPVIPARKQTWQAAFPLNSYGRHVSFEITTNQGYCALKLAQTEAKRRPNLKAIST